uniref:DUF5641 domain-containing protein n=1 Tax=Anopheles christyi TaxID=43041 RepID=A0A182K8G1_9DIPT
MAAALTNSKRQKNITLPRLELSGALLLCSPWQKIKHSLNHDYPCFYWEDSTIVLHWIGINPSRWNDAKSAKRFNIMHPAPDLNEHEVPEQLNTTELEERKITLVAQGQLHHRFFPLQSTLSGLVRMVAFLQRFTYNREPVNRIQEEVKPSSALISLAPQIVNGILRIGGRLRIASIPYDRKHPISLPCNDTFYYGRFAIRTHNNNFAFLEYWCRFLRTFVLLTDLQKGQPCEVLRRHCYRLLELGIIIQIESCLNYCPLTSISTDPEYLVPRTKWTKKRYNIQLGTLVLLKEENLPPLKWCYRRVTQVFRGDEGNIRVVTSER